MPLTNKTIMLDLDSTLIYTSDDFDKYKNLRIYTDHKNFHLRNRVYQFNVMDVVEKPGTGVKSSMWGVLRPHVREFLEFCFDYFETVIVWSAGQLRYVHAICDVLFDNPYKQPHLIYTYDDCERTDNYLYKPLTKIGEQVFPHIGLDKIYALDDNEMTFSKNKYNALHIPPYEPELTPEGIMAPDSTLINVTNWLMKPEVISSSDVRLTLKGDCFTCDTMFTDYSKYFD